MVTVAVMGAGSRGQEYTAYGKLYPNTIQVVAVADISEYRRNKMGDDWNIPAENRFGDFHEMLEAGKKRGKLADILIIGLPDDLHFEPAMEAMLQGYHLLLEKPMAQTAEECIKLRERQHETGVKVAVGHVLRYAPYYIALKKEIESGSIGELVNIQHMEPVMYAHMAHSFVRGNWHNSKATTPMILAKTCHDMDILRWLVGKKCLRVSTEGNVFLFNKEHCPKDAPKRCTDGCPHEKDCPYSAIDIYARKQWFLYVFDLKRDNSAADAPLREDILEKLRTTDYGRCVYQMDNDQPDHIVHSLLFEGGVTASFTMDAFTPWGGRRTRVMGTRGYIDGNGKTFDVYRFDKMDKSLNQVPDHTWELKVDELSNYKDSGHAGGDLMLIRDLVDAVRLNDDSKLSSSIDVSVESHLMGFAAERSRLSNRKEEVV